MRKIASEPAVAFRVLGRTTLRDVAPKRFNAAGSASAALMSKSCGSSSKPRRLGTEWDWDASDLTRLKKSLTTYRLGGETSSAAILEMAAKGGRGLPTEPLGAPSVGLKWASPQPALNGRATWEGKAACIPERDTNCFRGPCGPGSQLALFGLGTCTP